MAGWSGGIRAAAILAGRSRARPQVLLTPEPAPPKTCLACPCRLIKDMSGKTTRRR
jgi:hypothetical protein